MQELVIGGTYYHHKKPDKFYRVEWVARMKNRHEEDELQEHVIYRALYPIEGFGDNSLWVRPVDMFLETVEIDGKQIPRFTHVPTA